MTRSILIARRVLAVVLAAVVVMSMVPAGGPVGTASADHDCDTLNKVTWFTFQGISLIGEATDGSGVGCDLWHPSTSVEDVRDAESNQTKVDIYSAAAGVSDANEDYETVYDNYLNDTDSIAWSKAEVAIAEAHDEGKTKAEAKVAGKAAIADYYTTKQINLVNRWNNTIVQLGYLSNRSDQEGHGSNYFFSANFAQFAFKHGNYDSSVNDDEYAFVGSYDAGTQTATLANASTIEVKMVKTTVGSGDLADSQTGSFVGGAIDHSSPDEDVYALGVEAHDGDSERIEVINLTEYNQRWQAIDTKESALYGEIDVFVDGIWTDLESGNINSSEVVSTNTLMFEYGTDSIEGENFYDSVGALAGMGIPSPYLNETGTMTVHWNETGQDYQGLLFGNPPGGTWDVGREYNATDEFNKTVTMATTDGTMVDIDSGNFTVTQAESVDGNQLDEVQTREYNYATSDTGTLQQVVDDLTELTGDIQDRVDEEVESGGGGGSGGSGVLDWLRSSSLLGMGIPNAVIVAGGFIGLYALTGREGR